MDAFNVQHKTRAFRRGQDTTQASNEIIEVLCPPRYSPFDHSFPRLLVSMVHGPVESNIGPLPAVSISMTIISIIRNLIKNFEGIGVRG